MLPQEARASKKKRQHRGGMAMQLHEVDARRHSQQRSWLISWEMLGVYLPKEQNRIQNIGHMQGIDL